MNISSGVGLLKRTFSEWSEDKAPRLGAALAYYSVFSIPALILIVIGVIGLIYKGDVAGAIQQHLGALIGEDAARTMMATGKQQGASGGIVASIVGIVLLLVGASGVFGELQDSLNTIWRVKPKPDRGIIAIVKDRFVSFTMVLGIAFVLLVSLVLSAALAAMGSAISAWIPGGEIVGHLLEVVVSLAVVTVLFAMIFKILPDVKLAWNDVWIGAAVTAVLFTIGKVAIGLYLGKATIGSAYGAAGSVIVMIVWVYYSAQILLFGAEFTRVYANQYGLRIVAEDNAEPVTSADRARQGLAPHVEPDRRTESAKPIEPSLAPSFGIAAFVGMLAGFVIGRRTKMSQERADQDDRRKAA